MGDNLGNRMKGYENITRYYLTRRTPVIIRLDGKGFHSFTKGFVRPFDDILTNVMYQTMKELCENVEGCIIGYTQSDEISLVMCDYQKLDTNAWFSNGLLKICSITASLATSAFNKYFRKAVENADGIYKKRIDKANFDSRAFSIPKEEVNNYMIWRQQDAIRNSIQVTAQAYFSHNQLLGVNCNKAVKMLLSEKNIDWNGFPLSLQRGVCGIRKPFVINEGTANEALRMKWVLDMEIPLFTEKRDYIEKRIYFEGV
ncbi:MAG: tRNA(His) guanylyltransferase Thg1 family protein [Oscillospiraceae bacterium]|nr:tRNA(His) guanylyltransferase Thg1 family protein [Oscillospiraceae bacterium]